MTSAAHTASPTPIRIRPARAADATAIAALAGQLGYPSSADDVRTRLEGLDSRGGNAVFAAGAADGAVIGWVHVFHRPSLESDGDAEIGGLIVDEAQRGRGVGRALVAAAEQWARERGLPAIRVRSNVIREDARRFYTARGFTELKTQRVFRKTFSSG